MQYSDTTNKNGIIQRIEQWTGLGDAGVSGNATLLKVVTAQVNEATDELMPLVMSFSDYLAWDDENHTDFPVATTNIVSGQSDYPFAEDDNSLDVLNITNVKILPNATATDYVDLQRIMADDPLAPYAMSPNSDATGSPLYYLEFGSSIFLYPQPDYNATAGIKIYFEREQSYFASTDTTKEPGIPKPFHPLLPKIAAYNWLLINKPSNTAVITRLEAQIANDKQNLERIILNRNPRKRTLRPKKILYV